VLTPSTEKFQNVLQRAHRLYEQDPDWVTFFREVLGVDGVVRQTFPSLDELTSFEKSTEFEQIQQWIVKLREKRTSADTDTEPTRVITVRLPRSMHEYLKTEAHDLRTSMNKLCISKLLQVIEQDKIPTERAGGTPRRAAQPPMPSAAQQATIPMGNHSGHAPSPGPTAPTLAPTSFHSTTY
jgi:predicted HicB family RNase H-like nuclease